MNLFRVLVLVSGAALFAGLVYHAGIAQLYQDFLTLGWSLVPFVALSGVENFFHAVSSKYCFPRSHQGTIPLWRLFAAYQTGQAYNIVTPTGEMGGEIVRGAIFERYVPRSVAASAVIVNKLTATVARLAMACCCAGIAVPLLDLQGLNAWAIAAASLLIASALAAFAVLQVKGRFAPLLTRVAQLGGPACADWVRENVGDLDLRLRQYYRESGTDWLRAMLWNQVGFGVGILQRWYIMSLLLPEAEVTFFAAVVVWGVINLSDILLFFVTAGLGVQEAAYKLAFAALGLPGGKGVVLSVAFRIDQIFWVGFGLTCDWLDMVTSRLRSPQPASQSE